MNKETRFFNEEMLQNIKKFKEESKGFCKILYVTYHNDVIYTIFQNVIGSDRYEKALTELKEEFKKREIKTIKPLTEDEVKKMFPLYKVTGIVNLFHLYTRCDLCKHEQVYKLDFKELIFSVFICQDCVDKWRKTNE